MAIPFPPIYCRLVEVISDWRWRQNSAERRNPKSPNWFGECEKTVNVHIICGAEVWREDKKFTYILVSYICSPTLRPDRKLSSILSQFTYIYFFGAPGCSHSGRFLRERSKCIQSFLVAVVNIRVDIWRSTYIRWFFSFLYNACKAFFSHFLLLFWSFSHLHTIYGQSFPFDRFSPSDARDLRYDSHL